MFRSPLKTILRRMESSATDKDTRIEPNGHSVRLSLSRALLPMALFYLFCRCSRIGFEPFPLSGSGSGPGSGGIEADGGSTSIDASDSALDMSLVLDGSATLDSSVPQDGGADTFNADGALGDAASSTCRLSASCIRLSATNPDCLSAETGPFIEEARFTSLVSARGIYTFKERVIVADTTGGLRSLSFDGSAFAQIEQRADIAWTQHISSDGTHLLVSSPGTGFFVFDVDDTGSFVDIASETSTLDEARRAWSLNGRIYVPVGVPGTWTVTRQGSTLTPQSQTASLAFTTGAWSDGTYVYVANSTGLQAFGVSGDSLQLLDSVTYSASDSHVVGIDNYIFAGSAAGVRAFTFDGTSLTQVGLGSTPETVVGLWADGVHVFAAARLAGLYAFTFDGSDFTEVDAVDTDGDAQAVIGDGEFIYLADRGGGVKAYSGFSCLQRR